MVASFNGSSEFPLALGVSTLVGWWQFNEGSGSTATDASQSANSATLTGTSWVSQAGLSAGGLSLAGSSGSHADPSGFTNINFDRTAPFSVSTWFVLNNTGGTGVDNPRIFSRQGTGAGGGGWEIGANYNQNAGTCTSTTWCFWFALVNTDTTNNLTYTGAPLTTGVLHNVIVTYSGNSAPGGINVYLDGVLSAAQVNETNLSSPTVNSIIPRIGGRIAAQSCTSCYFHGVLGPLGIWNRVLAAGEVATIQVNPYAVIN